MERKIIGTTTVFFTDRGREKNKGILKLTHPAMLAEDETLHWLDSVHLDDVAANRTQTCGQLQKMPCPKGLCCWRILHGKQLMNGKNGFRKIIRRKNVCICWHWVMLAVLC